MNRKITMTIALFALLAASSAFAQGLLGRSSLLGARRANRQSAVQPPQEIYEKVPEEHRNSVKWAIAVKAWKAADSETSERFGVIMRSSEENLAWTNDCGKGVIIFDFATDGKRERDCRKFGADGRLVQIGSPDTFEEFKWRDKRRDELILAYWNDPAIVAAAISNSVAAASNSTPRIVRPFRPKRPSLVERPSPRLEERIPLEEAMALAKKGEGKGYYQLALSYSLGDVLPENRELSYKMLQKACAANYANAVLVEGMCDERDTFGLNRNGYELESEINKYCYSNYWRAAAFRTARTRREDEGCSVTNAVAFARIMGKYERAKELGVLAATNQIVALNKRLADFRKKESEAEQAKENDRQIKEMLGEAAPNKEQPQ